MEPSVSVLSPSRADRIDQQYPGAMRPASGHLVTTPAPWEPGPSAAIRYHVRVCEFAGQLKLCSCEGESLSDPDWVLELRDATLPERPRRGRALMPRFSDDEQACIDALLARLDGGGAFDFDYRPSEGDVLRLRVRLVSGADQRRNVRFRFLEGRWTHDLSIFVAGWRAQMSERDRGTIDE